MSGHRLDPDGPGRLLTAPGLARVLTALSVPGEHTRLVGGCVRDALLGHPSNDIDLATTLLPEAVIARARAAGLRSIPTGIAHGTVTLMAEGATFEVTTLREDIETDGRHAVVRFGRDFGLDAARRDFTINALSVDANGELHDTTGGLADLAAGRVRFIGEAATRIREDALRILRFFRFQARYGAGAPDPEGLAACIGARAALDGLSRERVRAEFLKLLLAPGAVPAVTTLSETGLLGRLIGGIGDLRRFERVARPNWDETARLAALAVFSVDDAERLAQRLRLSKAEQNGLVAYAGALVAVKDRAEIDGFGVRSLTVVHGVRALALASAALDGGNRVHLTAEAHDLLGRMVRGDVPVPVFPLTGGDLMALGIPAGPEIGRRLGRARAVWLAGGCQADAGTRRILLARALD
ncbi:MAG: CCA tRNA nucleotidyltransferase [Methylobacterium sp.]|uniref:CCA tRNA nucleotidyltransferase n=1 Tax=Methylobacterium sp. TaxID=409 RepID=UPI0027236387|nr:CCA tRNA nucleotidyltransferase [Methylobacterium sp.]MDO9429336.1 CCA tRNA nucleotidyltransferase [Methylobacterium sp.]